jgi:hypothetical protein
MARVIVMKTLMGKWTVVMEMVKVMAMEKIMVMVTVELFGDQSL